MTGTTGAVTLRGPVAGQGARAEGVLRALPEWFGIEQSIVDYARDADELPTFVAEAGDELVGFLTLKPTSAQALELHVLGVRREWHRRGVGRRLVEAAAGYARAAGHTLLHVKTLAPSDPDENYAKTRAFYLACGFLPLEELTAVWGPDNPCLILVRCLAHEQATD